MKRGLLSVAGAALLLIIAPEGFAQPRILSLEETVKIAQDQSTFVGVSRQNLASSRQNILNSYGNFLPDARLSFYAGRNFVGPTSSIFIDPQGRPVQQEGFDHEQYAFSLNSSWTLFNWGTNVNSLRSAKSGAVAAQYDLQYEKDVVTARVLREYYNLVRNKELRRVQEESVEAARRNLEQVEAFYNIGSNTRADVLQARVRLGNTQLELITAKNNEEIAKAQLASTLNFGLEEDFDVSASLDNIAKIEPDLEEEVQYMLDHRSDLLASRARVQSASTGLAATSGQRWPTLTANLGYSWNDRVYPVNSNFFRSEYSWNVGVSLNWNIFDRFLTKSNILDAEASTRIADYNLQQGKLDAILEVKTLYLALQRADESMRVSEEQVAQARENLRLAEERYRVGAGTQLETIEAGAQLTQAQSILVEAKIDYLIAKADLKRATGRPVTAD